jgi:hypothetical protein
VSPGFKSRAPDQFLNSACEPVHHFENDDRAATQTQGCEASSPGQSVRRKVQRPEPPARPTPVEAIASLHEKLALWLSARTDRFSQLLSRGMNDEVRGQYLLSKANLSHAERAEL